MLEIWTLTSFVREQVFKHLAAQTAAARVLWIQSKRRQAREEGAWGWGEGCYCVLLLKCF